MPFDLKQIMVFVNRCHWLRCSNSSPFLGSLIVALTDQCNLSCAICSYGRKKSSAEKQPQQQIDLIALQKVIDQVCGFKLVRPRIHFTGGEPLLYGKFSQLAAYCRQKKVVWSLSTNGCALDRYFPEIVDGNCSRLNVSIHGLEEADGDMAVAQATRITANLKSLAEYKAKQGRTTPLIAVNYVINKRNIQNLARVLADFKLLPVHSLTFQHLIFSQQQLQTGDSLIPVSDSQLGQIREFIQYAVNNPAGFPVQFYPWIKPEDIVRYYTDYNYPFRKSCILPWLVLRILADGSVRACDETELGSIHREDLRGLWNNQQNREFRQRLRRAGIFEGCQRCCHRQYY